jgi:hypothetical protein
MIEKQWFSCFISWSPLKHCHKQHESSQILNGPQHKNQPASQQITESPLIPITIKTIPNLSWDVSGAFVMIEKQYG